MQVVCLKEKHDYLKLKKCQYYKRYTAIKKKIGQVKHWSLKVQIYMICF